MTTQNSNYTVLARRFRPQEFKEVVGQQHIAQALQNAILNQRVAHAYLFTGARGVGKTSMARILAKALNCSESQAAIPCNQCEVCQSISLGQDVDVLEIDGASNRGIDDIRSLRANVNVKSMRSQYKLYIIDEVHMLTKEAFNALLKTLEEPPANVKFVFCTTEPNKVPDTILSRCQRFDFATIDPDAITSRLGQIAQQEGFHVEDQALELVSRRAAGSMRDAQSLFDQLLAFGSETISAKDVHALLGTATDEQLVQIVGALIDRQMGLALDEFDQLLSQGVHCGELIDQLLHYLRDLMMVASGADRINLLSVSEHQRAELNQQAQQWGLPTIVSAMQILSEAQTRMYRMRSPRPLSELVLVQICLLKDLAALDQIIGDLRQKKSNSPINPPKLSLNSRKKMALPNPPQTTSNTEPNTEAVKSSAPQTHEQTTSTKNETEETVSATSSANLIEFESGAEKAIWSQIVLNLNDMLKNQIKVVSEVVIAGTNRLDVIFPKSYHFNKQYCEQPKVVERLEKIAREITGKHIKISFSLKEEEQPESSPVKNQEPKSTLKSTEPTRDVQPNPFIERAISVFNANIIKRQKISNPLIKED